MNPKQILTNLLQRKAPGARPQVTARAGKVLKVAADLYNRFVRLLLPLLTPAQRLQLKDASALGMPHFLRTYERILEESPPLRAGLGLPPRYLGDLRKTHAALLQITEKAARLHGGAVDGERLVLAELRRCLDEIGDAAAQIAADEAADPAIRQQAVGFVRFLSSYRDRYAQAERARQLRARRRVVKAEGRKAELLHAVEVQELKRELLGPEAAADLPPPAVPAPDPETEAGARRRAAEEDEALLPAGAPVDACLEAPVAEYQACAVQLEACIGELALPAIAEEDLEDLAQSDPLLDGDLGALVAEVLPGYGWLTDATTRTGADLQDGVDQLDALGRLQAAAGLLARGARDGAVVIGKLALITHQQAQTWLRGREEEPAQRLRLQVSGAFDLLRRSELQREAPARAAEGRVAAIQRDTAEQLTDAAAAHTESRIKAGEDVPKTDLAAAVAHRRKAPVKRPAAPPKGRRTRPR